VSIKNAHPSSPNHRSCARTPGCHSGLPIQGQITGQLPSGTGSDCATFDHRDLDGPTFIQYVDILIPNSAEPGSPVLFVLGGESAATTRRLVGLYQAYGQHPDLILIQAEHCSYGKSISLDVDQTIPAYVTFDQSLSDFHAVIQYLKQTYTGIWMAAGYSYSGELVIDLAVRYPDDIAAILSSSGVVDWPFTMLAYDAMVRVIFGETTYQRLVTHTNKLQPQEMFDHNWLEREFLIAFIHGISQFTAFNLTVRFSKPLLSYPPLFCWPSCTGWIVPSPSKAAGIMPSPKANSASPVKKPLL
jgi:pimeloyl-ACP methyl ester carboxylesterase